MTLEEFLQAELADSESGFSIGVNGAIAEFFRDPSENGIDSERGRHTVQTPRGALRIELCEGVRPVAIETPSRHANFWQQRVALCLAQPLAAMPARTVITALGEDTDAVRDGDRGKLRFDLGLGLAHVDACVRTDDQALVKVLRRHCGRQLLKDAAEVISAIIEESPTRVFVSRLGRIEVDTPIPVDRTVLGPHTHLLPELLGKADAAADWIPVDALSCLDVYPANPSRRESGEARPFDAERHARFQNALSLWGAPEYLEAKQDIRERLRRGELPDELAPSATPLAQCARRVALRQLAMTEPDSSLIPAWRNALEAGEAAPAEPDPVPR